jgi:hypothetical protein
MPGVVYQDHGARLDPIEPGVSDRGGANNLIAPRNVISKNCAGEVTSGFLVGVEKADLDALSKEYPTFSTGCEKIPASAWPIGSNKRSNRIRTFL